ncbi:ROK family protein [Arthrobacter halodurans]|uniref:ROK family protein n=1 Tax=Arthrobacter halodurans TaxID=516699 RepID=A0ABV4UIS2_9MICC
MARPGVVLALDIGGTTIKGSIFADGREVAGGHTAPTFSVSSRALDTVLAVLAKLAETARGLGLQPTAIGVGVPGLVDARRGVVVYAANLQWAHLPLAQLLETRFALPVSIDHDARAAARAEMALRSGAGDFVFVPIGTGISAAVVLGGQIIGGARGQAGELGHIPVVPGGEACPCGQFGCLEAYASGKGIRARYLAAGGRRARNAAEVAGLLGMDPVADRVWSDAVGALSTAVTTLTALLDPTDVILGGGLSAAGPLLLGPLRATVDDMLGWREPPTLALSRAGPRAGLLGAALLGAASGNPPELNPSTGAQ